MDRTGHCPALVRVHKRAADLNLAIGVPYIPRSLGFLLCSSFLSPKSALQLLLLAIYGC
jgi:hypothetical protein